MPTPHDPSLQRTRLLADTRPLWIILLSRFWRYWVIAFLVLAMVVVLLLPTPEGLTREGQKALAVFVLCVGLWITAALPLHITSILAIVLVPQLGILSSRATYSNFGNVAVFFILGAFILSAGLSETGLSTRMALKLLDRFGKSPLSLRRGVFYLCAFSSFLMSEHAVAALVFPIVMEIVRVLGLRPGQSRYAQSLFLAMSWGCIIGGIATLLGGARAPLALGMLEEATGLQIGFFAWMLAGLPTVLGALLIGEILLSTQFRIDIQSVERAQQMLRQQIQHMGPMSGKEKLAGLILLCAVFSWMFLNRWIGLADTALMAVVALFVLEIVDWKKIEESVNWGVILMYGGAICLGKVMEETGAAEWMGHALVGNHVNSAIVLIAIVSLASLFLTECISNAAVIAFLFPVVLGMGETWGIPPQVVTFAITFPAGLAFMFPMGTPATAIAYSSGHFRSIDLIRPGLILNFSCWILFILTALFWWPLLGYAIG